MTLLPVCMEGLTPEMVRKAEEELGETEDSKAQGLKDLRRLINEESDFRPLMDEPFLVRFLRGRKYDPQQAFNALRNFYTFKLRYSRILSDFKPSEVRKLLEMNIMTLLPVRDRGGAAVGILRIGLMDMEQATPNDLVAAILVCAEIGLENEATQVCGATLIIDFHKFSFNHMRNFASPTLLYRIVRAAQDCVPCRIKAIHLVNDPFYINVPFNIIKKFLSEKLRKRIYFHGSNLKGLHKHVPQECLPEELGGKLGPMDSKDFRSQVLNREAHFERINKYGFTGKKVQFIRKKSSRAVGLFL